MWVPVISLVWTFVYLMQGRFAPLKIADNDTSDEQKTSLKNSIVEIDDERKKNDSRIPVIESGDEKKVDPRKLTIESNDNKKLVSKKSIIESDYEKMVDPRKPIIEFNNEKIVHARKPIIDSDDEKQIGLRKPIIDFDDGNKADLKKLITPDDDKNKKDLVNHTFHSDCENTADSRDSTVESDDESKADTRKMKGECFYNIEEMVTKVTAVYPRARINYNTVTLLGLTLGLGGGWTSPFLAKLTSPGSELPVTDIEASWIASLIQLGRVAGAVIGSFGVAYLGSKFSVLCTGIPVVLSWIFLIIADSVGWIYLARSLQGISTGMFFSTFPLYAGEISNPKIRGAIISLIMNAMAVGFIIGNLLGSLTSMWLFSLISLVPSVAFLILFALLPASPHYLISRDRLDDAAKAIVWYQRDADVTTELESLKQFIDAQRESTFKGTLQELNIPRNRKAFTMVMIVFMLLQVGGTYAMGYYMEIILRRAGVKNIIDPGMAVVVIGVFGVTGGFFAMYANDKFGRKVVLAGSSGGLTISLIVLGIHYVLIQQGYETTSLEWLPVMTLIVFEFFICLGIGPVPSTIVSELFPPRTKSIAACAANMTSGLFAFISTKTYQQMVDVMPDQYVFWFYALMMASLGIYTVVSLPETKGKSLQEIQDMLAKSLEKYSLARYVQFVHTVHDFADVKTQIFERLLGRVAMVPFWTDLLVNWTTWPQWLATSEVSLLGLVLGLVGGWTSPFLAKLTSPDSELPVTDIEASWIASLIQLGRVVGAMVGSFGVAYLGSKFSILCTAMPVALSWIFLLRADSVGWVYIARSLQGISSGMFFSTFPLYAGEISNPKIRGAVIGLAINAIAVGSIVGNLLGFLTSMWLFSLISLVPSVAFLILFAFLPDSPHYLVSRDRLDDAAKAIVWYQRDADVITVLESLRQFIHTQREATFKDILRELNVPINRKAFMMVMIVFMLLEIGGTDPLGYYAEIILRRAGVKNVIDPGMAVVGIGIFGIAGGFLAMYANDKFGRRFVLAGSSAGMTITLIGLGIHYALIQQGYGTTSLEWLPVISLVVSEFFICLGIGSVPSTIVSEFFPPRTKSIATCAAYMTSGLFAFISTKTYQQMVDVMPDQYVFWFYALMMAALGTYTVISLPETKGKSLQEIQDMLAKR